MDRTLRWGRGDEGKPGHQCGIAEVTGSSQRRWLDTSCEDSPEEHRTILGCTDELEPDHLYELYEEGDRWVALCYSRDGEVGLEQVSDARARAWMAALDAGQSCKEARLATKGM